MIEVFVIALAVLLGMGLSVMWVGGYKAQRGRVASATCSDIYDLLDWVSAVAPVELARDSCIQDSHGSGSETCHPRYPGDTMLDLWEGYGTVGACTAQAFYSGDLPTYGAELRLYVTEDYLGGSQMEVRLSDMLHALLVWRYSFEGPTSLRDVFGDLHMVLISSANPPTPIQGRADVFRALLEQRDLLDGTVGALKICVEYANTVWEEQVAASCNEIDLNPEAGVVLLRYGAFEL